MPKIKPAKVVQHLYDVNYTTFKKSKEFLGKKRIDATFVDREILYHKFYTNLSVH